MKRSFTALNGFTYDIMVQHRGIRFRRWCCSAIFFLGLNFLTETDAVAATSLVPTVSKVADVITVASPSREVLQPVLQPKID